METSAISSTSGLFILIAFGGVVWGVWFGVKLNSIDKNLRELAENSRRQVSLLSRLEAPKPQTSLTSTGAKPQTPITADQSVLEQRARLVANLDDSELERD